jgi:hypothetical protein
VFGSSFTGESLTCVIPASIRSATGEGPLPDACASAR